MSRIAHQIRPGDFKFFMVVLRRQFKLTISNVSTLLHPLFYFLVAITAFKIAIGSNHHSTEIGVGMIVIINTFAILLTHETLIFRDYQLGFLEQFYLVGCEFSLVVLAKYLAHFILYSLILICFMPIIMFISNIGVEYWIQVILSQILLSALVILILLLASSILLGSKNRTLLSIIVLVLIFPALIFSTIGVFYPEYLMLMVALLLFLLPINIIASKHLIIAALMDS